MSKVEEESIFEVTISDRSDTSPISFAARKYSSTARASSHAGGGGVPRGYESVGALALAAGPRFPIGLVEFSWFEFS